MGVFHAALDAISWPIGLRMVKQILRIRERLLSFCVAVGWKFNGFFNNVLLMSLLMKNGM